MKYFLLLSSVFIVRSLCAQDASGLVGQWKMDGSCALNDEITTSSSNGVLNDVSSGPNKDNIANSALAFNLNTSYVTLGAVEKLKLSSDKTVSFWIKPVLTGAARTGSIFVYGTGINIRYLEQSSTAKLNIVFGNTSYMEVSLQQGQWQLVTITFKKDFSSTKSKVVAYVNGALIGEAQQNKSTHDFNNAIALIGPASQSSLTNGFRGSLDDLRIYSRALTQQEILNAVLPVKLQYFKGKKLKGSVEITWRTELEDNVSHFDLQKSADGISFRDISQIDPGKFNYLAYDAESIFSHFAWYRLRIVDRDGSTTFSNVIKVSADEAGDADAIRLFPNPVVDHIYVSGFAEAGNVTIVNGSGAVVRRLLLKQGQAIDVSGLATGLYYISIFDGKKTMATKFVRR
jgi:hypothetical protein